MILGIGLDLCEIERMRLALAKPRFLERVFTSAERERIEAAADPRRGQIAAGLFAAKEAAAKALGTGFTGFGPADVEIVPDSKGMPVCTLYRGAAVRADALSEGRAWRLLVSITHENGCAAATAILEN